RTGCDDLYKALTTWPSWFFARGDLAAGGAGDESPLVFDDSTLKAAPAHHYTYALGARGGRRGAPPAPGPSKVFLVFTDVHPAAGVARVVIWRNARVVTRAAPPAGRAARGAAAGTVVARGSVSPVLSTQSLRSMLPAEAAAAFAFGKSPDGAPIGPEDFA